MTRRGSRPELGRVTQAGFEKLKQQLLEKTLKPHTHGLSYWEDYVKGRDETTRAFGYLNGLGYVYGYSLAEAFLSEFLSAKNSEEAQKAAETASIDLRAWLNDVAERAPTLDVHLIREAIKAVGDQMPAGDDPERMIAVGLEHEKGLYIRDFSWSVAGALQSAQRAIDLFRAWNQPAYAIDYDAYKMEYIPEFLLDPSREEIKRSLKVANTEINKRTYYGHHTETLPSHPIFSIIGWSNGSETWMIMWGYLNPAVEKVMLHGGGTISLDANYALVEIHPYILSRILDELDPLPLAEFSFESKMRGRYPHADERTVKRILRAIVDAESPNEDPEERALMAMDFWTLLQKAKIGALGAQAALGVVLTNLKNPIKPYLKIITDWLDAR